MKTKDTTERERSKGSLEARTKSETPSTTEGNRNQLGNVISLADYKAKKKKQDSVKATFKDSLDNDAVMRRYNINQPTIEERQERIKESIQRINKLMQEIKG